jgi:hypothetical protein
MIGYLQSMQPDEVLIEVNAECQGKSFPDLVLVGELKLGATSRFEHAFERPFQMSPFKLHHFWIDLR